MPRNGCDSCWKLHAGSPPDPEPDPFSNAKPLKDDEDDEKPQHRVNIKSFTIGKYTVTQEQWFAVMGNNPSSNKGRTLPVTDVSWNDVQLFLRKLSQKTGKKYRLPTEAEWEYAARAGTTTKYFWGDDATQAKDYAWFSDNSERRTHPVGLKKPNQFGLHDMVGNVYQWVQDCWNPTYKNAPTDGSAWSSGECSLRVTRGVSWIIGTWQMHTARRGYSTAATVYPGIGFRIVRDL